MSLSHVRQVARRSSITSFTESFASDVTHVQEDSGHLAVPSSGSPRTRYQHLQRSIHLQHNVLRALSPCPTEEITSWSTACSFPLPPVCGPAVHEGPGHAGYGDDEHDGEMAMAFLKREMQAWNIDDTEWGENGPFDAPFLRHLGGKRKSRMAAARESVLDPTLYQLAERAASPPIEVHSLPPPPPGRVNTSRIPRKSSLKKRPPIPVPAPVPAPPPPKVVAAPNPARAQPQYCDTCSYPLNSQDCMLSHPKHSLKPPRFSFPQSVNSQSFPPSDPCIPSPPATPVLSPISVDCDYVSSEPPSPATDADDPTITSFFPSDSESEEESLWDYAVASFSIETTTERPSWNRDVDALRRGLAPPPPARRDSRRASRRESAFKPYTHPTRRVHTPVERVPSSRWSEDSAHYRPEPVSTPRTLEVPISVSRKSSSSTLSSVARRLRLTSLPSKKFASAHRVRSNESELRSGWIA